MSLGDFIWGFIACEALIFGVALAAMYAGACAEEIRRGRRARDFRRAADKTNRAVAGAQADRGRTPVIPLRRNA
jgi:hypothetical protein